MAGPNMRKIAVQNLKTAAALLGANTPENDRTAGMLIESAGNLVEGLGGPTTKPIETAKPQQPVAAGVK